MTPPPHLPDSTDEDYPDMPLERVDFPSDALSIKRLRTMAPFDFDVVEAAPAPVEIAWPFFDQFGSRLREGWLFNLNQMLGFERVLAQEVFHRTRGDREPFGEDDAMRAHKQREYLDPARPALERLYQQFRLADSPETARLLVSLIEKQAVQFAHESLAPGRSPS